VVFLHNYFKDTSVVSDLLQKFKIGTAKGNKTVFWLVDRVGLVRSGQIIWYNPTNGKRDKNVKVGWVHSNLKLENFVLSQCFFGEHQLRTVPVSKPIAIVESPKTAVIMTAIDQRFIWLASCGAAGLQPRKFKGLEGRDIYLFPDLGKSHDEWESQAAYLNDIGFKVKVSSILKGYIQTLTDEAAATKSGYDIADFAIQFDWYAQHKAKSMTTDDKMLQTMMTTNPNLSLLMERFELINSKTMRGFNV
jgi:Domain of unknown function (DUF6371)